MVLPHALQAQ